MTQRTFGKNIKVFLSSTFRDMDAERDAIMNRVYPAVAQQLARHNIHVDFIDLRWGVSTSDVDEADRENHVLRECLGGIQSSRPFFIGLLGDRYGWVPSQASWDAIVDGMSADERLFVNTDTQQARSVTELEILFGSLMDTDNLHRSFFCFRSPEAYQQMGADERARYCEQDETATRRLALLKEKITRTFHAHSLDRNICHYNCQWDGTQLTHLDTLVRFLTTALVQEIELYECEDATANPDNDFENITSVAQERMAQSNRLFCGREDWLQWLEQYAYGTHGTPSDAPNGEANPSASNDNAHAPKLHHGKVLLATGPYGFGKTALLCKFYQQLAQSQHFIPYIFFADRKQANCQASMPLKCWLSDSRTATEYRCGIDNDEDFGLLAHLLGKALSTNDRRKVLLIDDVCRLDNCHLLLNSHWVPANTVVICTAESGEAEGITLCDKIALSPLSRQEAQQLIDKRLAEVGKRLQPAVMEALLNKQARRIHPSTIPLWSVMMTRRLTLLNASYFEATRQRQEANEELKIQNSLIEIVSQAANYPEPLFMSILQEGGHFVDMAFGMTVLRMLAVSEYGLREGDLRQLLGNDWDALKFAELRRYLGPLLTTDSVSGIIDFAYPNFRIEVCVQSADAISRYVAALASHLLQTIEDNPFDAVAIRELPYLALKYQTTDLLDFVVLNQGMVWHRHVVYALSDLTISQWNFMEQWLSKAATRHPEATALLMLDVMRQLADRGSYGAATAIGGALAKVYHNDEAQTAASGEAKPLAIGNLTAFFAVCLYYQGERPLAAQWANWLLNEHLQQMDDDRYMALFAWAIYARVAVWCHECGEADGKVDADEAHLMEQWTLHGLSFAQCLVLDHHRLEFLGIQQELAVVFRQMLQLRDFDGEEPNQLLLADVLNEQPWLYRAYFQIAPMRRLSHLMGYIERHAATVLEAEAQRLSDTLREAAPNHVLFADNCQTPTDPLCEEEGEGQVVARADQLLFQDADPQQCSDVLNSAPALLDDNRTDALGVRAHLMHFCMALPNNTTQRDLTPQEVATIRRFANYANRIIGAYPNETNPDTQRAMGDFMLLYTKVAMQLKALPMSQLYSFALFVFGTERQLFMQQQEQASVEQTLRLQIAFYMLCSMAEFLFSERTNAGASSEASNEEEHTINAVRFMKSLHLPGALVVQGYALVYACLAYVCEQRRDLQNMMLYNKQHEYATCEAWRLNPSDHETARRYASAVDETGRLFYMIFGNYKEAKRCYTKAHAMFKELYDKDPAGTILNDVLLSSYNILEMLNIENRYDALCQKAEQTLTFVAAHYANPDLELSHVAAIKELMGHALVRLGRTDEAQRQLNEAKAVYAEKLSQAPNNEKNMRDMAICIMRIVEMKLAASCNADEVLQLIDEAERLLKRALEIVPNSPKAIKNYLALLNTKVKVHVLMRNFEATDEALTLFEHFTLQHILETRDTSLVPLMLAYYDDFVQVGAQAQWMEMANALIQVKQHAVDQLVEQRLMKANG